MASNDPHWQRNLWVCVFGSFTTIVAMTVLLPFLPLYVEHLGVTDTAAIVQWSGAAYAATFLSAGLTAPLWGRLGDRYGRKLMLIRASLGMAVAMAMIGLAQSAWQLVALRLLAGLLGGYASGSTILVATQAPKARSGWALGVLASGIMAGNLAGPLLGGLLPPLVGIRTTFFLCGGVIFVAFLATALLLKETPVPRSAARLAPGASPQALSRQVTTMLGTAAALMFATMSIEPIITVYFQQLQVSQVTWMAGLAMAATALGSIVSASRLGKLADRVGHWRVLSGCLALAAVLLIPQALVTAGWQLVALRFAMGLALGGLLPCITSIIRHGVADQVAGRVLGYSTSCQYAGQVLGPLAGGYLGGHVGMRSVFWVTCLLLAGLAAVTWRTRPATA
jgi:MFS family permease